jgi:hypothetical protein
MTQAKVRLVKTNRLGRNRWQQSARASIDFEMTGRRGPHDLANVSASNWVEMTPELFSPTLTRKQLRRICSTACSC